MVYTYISWALKTDFSRAWFQIFRRFAPVAFFFAYNLAYGWAITIGGDDWEELGEGIPEKWDCRSGGGRRDGAGGPKDSRGGASELDTSLKSLVVGEGEAC